MGVGVIDGVGVMLGGGGLGIVGTGLGDGLGDGEGVGVTAPWGFWS